jgi:hypothetical protein
MGVNVVLLIYVYRVVCIVGLGRNPVRGLELSCIMLGCSS